MGYGGCFSPPGLRWVDVGCGNGAFTENIIGRCAPSEVHGVVPSEGQLAYARSRPGVARLCKFQHGDAMALPFEANSFDAAVMALVLFFLREPAKGVAEMARVVKPGGTVSAYVWNVFGGGAPTEPLYVEMRARGLKPVLPSDCSRTSVCPSSISKRRDSPPSRRRR